MEIAEISGLKYIPNFISQTQHDRLLQQIDSQPWLSDLKRRVQHYGYKYDYKARAIDRSLHLGPLPDWLLAVASGLHGEQLTGELADQAIVNEYRPGQGISRHVDCVSCFAGAIACLSFGSPCVMDFTHRQTGRKVPVLLEPKSLILLAGEARYQWAHAIAPRKSDRFQGQIVKRERRVSLTFRKVILSGNRE